MATTVLLVEDDPEILRLMKQVLSRDFIVHTAASAEEALQLLRQERFGAVVSDHMLPAMTGVELLREVTRLQPDAARVLVTASTQVATAQEAINVARVRRFLSKPFRAQELLSTVGEAVHEVAVAQIKTELVRELKERNSELARAMAQVEARDVDLVRRLEGFAVHDPVTGLFIHRYFQEALSAELFRARASGRGFSVGMVDILRFGEWNREYGYAEGDVLLRTVAQLLSGAEAASRYGGGRFAALLPGATGDHAQGWAQRLGEHARALAQAKDVAGRFEVRVGVATFPGDGADEPALLERCEAALDA